MPEIHGTMSIRTQNRRKQIRISNHDIKLGEVPLSNDKIGFTKLSLYVPSPSDIGHLPGMFLTLSNSAGRCFVRLNDGDLSMLIDFMYTNLPSLQTSLEEAKKITQELHQIDKKIHKENPLFNYSITDITEVKLAGGDPPAAAVELDPVSQ